jgi:hypothetical protein
MWPDHFTADYTASASDGLIAQTEFRRVKHDVVFKFANKKLFA